MRMSPDRIFRNHRNVPKHVAWDQEGRRRAYTRNERSAWPGVYLELRSLVEALSCVR